MPASKFTKKANTPAKKRQWRHVYEEALRRGLSKAKAIMEASGVVKNHPSRKKS